MRVAPLIAVCLLACTRQAPGAAAPQALASAPPSAEPAGSGSEETIAADSTRVTAGGVRYTAPAGWTVTTRERITIVTAQEGDLHLAIVEVDEREPEAALATAWKRYGQAPPARVQVMEGVKSGGWDRILWHVYEVPPHARRSVGADVRFHGDALAVLLIDAAQATLDKRGAQFGLLTDSIQPASYIPESFAGKTAHELDAARLAKLDAFVEHGRQEFGVPGAAVAVVQGGAVVHARGYGVRELGKPDPVGPRTLFRIASITKPLTTLLLARLVDAGKLRWEQPATELYPDFKLGDPATTASTHLEHLVCACTGLPRADMERLFEFGELTPRAAMAALATVQPTTKFGEAYQYSNELAAAAGYIAGHVLAPHKELGKAYDDAMQAWVFDPLAMRATTFDFKRALRSDHAAAHAFDFEANARVAPWEIDRSIIPFRPSGGAWSNADDMIKYVQLELAGGIATGGKRLVSEANLFKRREKYAAIGADGHYGIGLEVERDQASRWSATRARRGGI